MVEFIGAMFEFKVCVMICQTASSRRMFNDDEEPIICRLCLMKHSSHLFLIDTDISQKILDCCALQVFIDDGMPNRICEECLTTLDLIVSFRSQCAESDRLLKDGFFDVKLLKCELDILDKEYLPKRTAKKLVLRKNNRLENLQKFTGVKLENFSSGEKLLLNGKKVQETLKETDISLDLPKQQNPVVLKLEENNKVNDHAKNNERKFPIGNSGLCPFCGKTFDKFSSLRSHLRLHTKTKTHTCAKCSKSFREMRQLKDHERTHLNIKNIPCVECGRLFSTKSTANKHFEAVHRKSHTVTCKLCNKKLSSNRCLKGHMKTHTGEREFVCDICQQQFAFKNTLIVHIRSHTGERPYKCKYCDSRFSAPKSFKDHERLHTGIKPYVCPVCSKAYSQKCNMKSHFKNNHKDVELLV